MRLKKIEAKNVTIVILIIILVYFISLKENTQEIQKIETEIEPTFVENVTEETETQSWPEYIFVPDT